MPFVHAKGKRLHYKLKGKGTPLIFLHPSLSNYHAWDFQHVLSKHYQLILLDLPGHGESEAPDAEITVKLYADFVVDVATQLNLIKFIPIGLSLGGAISLQLALDHSQLLHGVVLIGTGAKMGVYPAIFEGLKLDFQKGIDLVIGELAFAPNSNPKIIELSKRECLKCNPTIGYSDFAACNAFDVRERLSEIGLSTLILVGSEDKLAPLKWSYYLKENIHHSTLCIIKGAGHMVQLERPKQFNHALLNFLLSLNL